MKVEVCDLKLSIISRITPFGFFALNDLKHSKIVSFLEFSMKYKSSTPFGVSEYDPATWHEYLPLFFFFVGLRTDHILALFLLNWNDASSKLKIRNDSLVSASKITLFLISYFNL